MPINNVSTYLTYADLQMAAEALFDAGFVPGLIPISELTDGNGRSSTFTPTQAAQFVDDWKVVDHQRNTSTGFSGTLFECLRDDPTRGLVRGQLVMCFRSTEFSDDAARDNQATNVMEVKEYGWAFGQIADMKQWFDGLNAPGGALAGKTFAVTGYSLGANLAAGFNKLLAEQGQGSRISATYTFNGAGVGEITSGTLSQTITQFQSLRDADQQSFFTTAVARDFYGRWRAELNGNADTLRRGQALGELTSLQATLSANPTANATALKELDLLTQAVGRGNRVLIEAERINAGISSGNASAPATHVDATSASIAAIGLDYQLAVLRASANTRAFSSGILDGLGLAIAADRAPLTLPGASPIYDLYGAPLPSAVSNSQHHYGTPMPVFIEDQPLTRGNFIGTTALGSLRFGEVKLLNDGFANNDFGDTHSLVLIVDSLNVQSALARLDTSVGQSTLDTVLRNASNTRGSSTIFTQGQAEFDTLERMVQALGDITGASQNAEWIRINPNPAGGTWAVRENEGGYTGRDTLHADLGLITNNRVFTGLVGQVRVVESHDPQLAHSDFAALLSLTSGASFSLRLNDPAPASAGSLALYAGRRDLYDQWLADRIAITEGRDRDVLNFTDSYLSDRTTLLNALNQRNGRDIGGNLVVTTSTPADRVLDFVYADALNGQNSTLAVINSTAVNGDMTGRHQTIAFGNDLANTLAGTNETKFGDHLYGGGGNDTVNGLAGADWLEGNAGDDTLDGGAGNDTLLGGAGTDTYNFSGAFGHDTVIDADGLGSIVVEGYGPLLGASAGRLTSGAFKGDDPRVRYTLVSSGSRQDLVIRFTDQPDRSITIRGWTGNPPAQTPVPSLGIDLANVDAPDPTTPNVATGTEVADEITWPGSAPAVRYAGLGGNDTIRALEPIPDFSYYGYTLAQYGSMLDGGDGDDALLGGDGVDIIDGGAGNDYVLGGIRTFTQFTTWYRNWGFDEVDAHAFIDQYVSQARRDADANVIDTGAGNDSVVGGWGDDVIDGGDDADVLWGLAGNDIVLGGAGDDGLRGDGDSRFFVSRDFTDAQGVYHPEVLTIAYTPKWLQGQDLLDGGAGNDILSGDGNDDQLYGGDGNDTLNGDSRRSSDVPDDLLALPLDVRGNDELDGGAGNDLLYGDAGDDVLWGGSGDDVLAGDDVQSRVAVEFHGDDMLDGGAGNDQLYGGGGNDFLEGGDGNDYLLGDGAEADVATSAHGDDVLDGGAGNDTLLGSGGNDDLSGGEGNDYLDGGDGNDTLDGGRGKDVLIGGQGNDWLISDGNDYLDGGAGDDTYVVVLDPAYIAQINDGLGHDTLVIDAASIDTASLQLFTQDTTVMLAVGTQGVIAIGPDVNLSNLAVHAADGTTITLQDLVTQGGGAIASAVRASDGTVSDTSSASAALTLEGSARNDALNGSAFGDLLRGRDGNDKLTGGDGSDWLEGGNGADRLVGGRGDDMLIGASDTGADSGGNVFSFQVGDGNDTIALGAITDASAAPNDFIEFGPGINASSLNVRNRAAGLGERAATLVIDYGPGDSISFTTGAEARFAGIRFADASVLGFDQVAAMVNPAQPTDGVLGGTGVGDVLLGGDGDGQIYGNDGDDLLDGGAGQDLLIGGRGVNRYRFAQNSGNDAITPTPGERGQLQFVDARLADLAATIEGLDLVIRQPSGAIVRLSNYLADAQIAATWSARGADGATVGLGSLLSLAQVTSAQSLAARRQQFIDSQFAQLGSAPQRVDQHFRLMTPETVQRIEQQVGAGGQIVLAPYLSTSTTATRMTFTTEDPIYETVTVHRPGSDAQFLSLAQLQNSNGTLLLPPGAQPVYGSGPRSPGDSGGIDANSTLIGYIVPGTSGTDTLEERIVGWNRGTAEAVVTAEHDRAVQSIVGGTAGDDAITVNPGFGFRGAIDAGAGNDSVVLSPEWNPLDWFYSIPGEFWNAGIALGRGAWINAGAGDDTVIGTDGEDFVIGGSGNDFLSGAQGADTYYVSAADGGVDTIDDHVEEDRLDRLFETVSLAGAPNQDVVEFAADVSMSALTYRWEDDPDVADRRILNFFDDGALFLKVVYDAPRFTQTRGEIQEFYFAEITQQLMSRFGGLALPGIEQFRFADGTVLRRDALLQQLAVQPDPPLNHAPTVTLPLTDQSAQADVAISVTLPSGTFGDVDAGDVLTLQAALVDGSALPAWLSFDAATQHFAGTPPTGLAGTSSIRVTATDRIGASAFDDFDIAVVAERSLTGTPGADTMVGTTGRDLFDGAAGDDTLTGLAGNDVLDGGAGNDSMAGGPGDDVYLVDATGDQVIELAGAGDDLVRSAVTWTLGNNTERLTLTGTVAINGTGNASNNVLTGNEANNALTGFAGDDWLDGGAGSDTLIGGAGNDTYLVDVASDGVTEKANEGNDTVMSSVTWTLGANVENLTLTGMLAINGIGNSLANLLIGNAANNTLNGGAGADTMQGGAGDDTYTVDNAGDVVIEAAGGGIDKVNASVSTTLWANVENLTLTGSTAINATGNALNNVLTGNGAANMLDGGAGDDTLVGGAGADTLIGGIGNDTYGVDSALDVVLENPGEGIDTVQSSVNFTLGNDLENLTLTGSTATLGTGNTLNNVLIGNGIGNTLNAGAGDDFLNGGAGADTLIGGTGDDTFVVNTAADVVTENPGEGNDTILSSATLTLAANVENLTLTGSGNLNGTGNTMANLITGNAGNNTLDGATGADTMRGGAGNDTYVVDDVADMAVEASGEGTDLVKTSVTTTLWANVENLTLTGTAAINGFGNALNNVLTGNSAANALAGDDGDDTLDGGAGSDTMTGGAGNDSYVVNVATDVVIENAGEGIDTVRSSVTFTLASNVENLTLTGGGNLGGTGNALDNLLTGNSGANTLSGGAGNDTYTGGAGNDTLNDTATTSNDVYQWGVGQGNDAITDAGGSDRIEIGAGVTASQLTLTRATNDLQIRISGATDVLTVRNWYAGTANRIEEIRLADGTVIDTGTAAPASLAGGMAAALRLGASHTSAPTARAFPSMDGDRAARLLVQAMSQFGGHRGPVDMPWHEPARHIAPFDLLVPK